MHIRWRHNFSKIVHTLKYVDPGYFIVISVCLLAIWPFISRPGLPQLTDSELHIFRLAELSRLIRAGELFPRWAPNFYYGYGYPIFNYYAPLSYYLALPVDLLPVLGPVEAVKSVFILSSLAAGVGMYGYVRDNWGKSAGILAATTYVYSPYIVLVDPHARGDLAESLSFAIFPLALWSLDRLRRRPTVLNWLASITFISAIILVHNLMAMVFFALLAAWSVWQLAVGGIQSLNANKGKTPSKWWRYRLFGALLLGAGVAAFFWLTVALEQNAVNLTSLVGEGSHFDYRNHFLSLHDLFSLPGLLDWGATEPAVSLSLGWPQILLGGIGLITVLTKRARHPRQAIFFAGALGLLVFMMLPNASLIWDTFPLLPYLQFPWRLLGATSALLAVMTGVGSRSILDNLSSTLRSWTPAILVALILLASMPLLQIPPWPAEFGPTTALRVLEEELSGRWLGTTSTADFVPATVELVPGPVSALVSDIRHDRPLDRVNRVTLPEGTTVTSDHRTPLNLRYHVSGEQDFLLRLFLFDFPGWSVKIDGKPAVTEVGRPEGFIVIPVERGNHLVEVKFSGTPARHLTAVVSILSLVVALGLAWRLSRLIGLDLMPDIEHVENGSDGQFVRILIAISSITLLYVLFVDPLGWLRYESTGLTAEPATNKAQINLGNQVALIGYDRPEGAVSPGDQISVTAYWKALHPLDINYQAFVHVLDAQGDPVAQSDKLNPGGFPTERWPVDKYVRDEYRIQLPASLEPAEYQLSIGLWSADGGWRLPILDQNGDQIDDSFKLPQPLIVK